MRLPNRLNWLLSYDLYERHYVVAQLIAARRRPSAIVLDVGGRVGLLARFTPCHVVSVNVDGSGDVQYAGGTLPFADRTCDVVTAIDTLEHLPRRQRSAFLLECLRVSRDTVIVAAPFNSPGHAEAETHLNAIFSQITGQPHPYLSEHIRYGLPDLEEINGWVTQSRARRYRLLFAGDYRRECRFFEAALRCRTTKNLWGRLSALVWHIRSRAVFNRLRLSNHPLAYTNRFYLELAIGRP
ncbi:MAG: methyltransferase domain-containing protein [Anaerolineae bacterium]|nr:methyltransferase domain-containing protein [Anaerolineae bacterium]